MTTTTALNLSSDAEFCETPEDLKFGYFMFRISPLFAFPIYGISMYLLLYHSTIQVKTIQILYMRNLLFNILSMLTITWILCPLFYLPMIGYQSIGIIQYLDVNLAIPPILTVYALLGVTISIMHLFHFRFVTISKMSDNKNKNSIQRMMNIAVWTTYFILVMTGVSYFGLLTIQALQPKYKPSVYQKFRISAVNCSRFIVADPYSWQVILAIITTIFYIVCAATTIISNGAFTLFLLLTSRSTISRQTMYIQRKFTAVMISQAVVHTVFILAPIISLLAAVYFEIRVRDGGLAIFIVESQQGTASTLIFIFTHSSTSKILKRSVKKYVGFRSIDSQDTMIWKTSVQEIRSRKSVVF